MTGRQDQPADPPFPSGGSILPASRFPPGAPIPMADEFKEILSSAMGLKSELVQEGALRNALAAFGQRYGGEAREWLARLRSDPEALNYFCGRLTVGETWFFRDWTPFACLKQFVEELTARADFQPPLRILSLPCSTGEEPWSMAMTLAQMGFKPGQALIDAVDINTHSLETLQARKYTAFSRRETNLEANTLLDRFTRPIPDGFEVDKNLAGFIKTHHGNILDGHLAPAGAGTRYHAIFSRNLFIYLDPASKKKGAKNLLKLLHPEGILYLGHTEGRVLDTFEVKLWKDAFLFAFTPKKESAPLIKTKAPAKRPAPTTPRSKSGVRSRRLAALAAPNPAFAAIKPKDGTPTHPDFQRALDAANSSDWKLATQLCATLVAKEPDKALNWCLAGMVEQVKGKTQDSLGMFDRALYLDPRHVPALQAAALLRRQLGQAALAEQLERRLALAIQKGRSEP